MAKICPITKEKVLYPDCLECEQRRQCKNLKDKEKKNENKK